MGIAHFAKRILRLHGLQRQAAAYGLPPVVRIAFPATSAAHLRHSWPSSMLQLINPSAQTEPVEVLQSQPGEGCCYDTVVTAARENTYFIQPDDADALRDAAYRLVGLPPTRDPCAPIQACYFQRSEGKPGGRWEGGARVIVNRGRLLRMMQAAVREIAPDSQGIVRLVNINSTHSFAQQISLFASCDIMASVHGSQNANLMFMRKGSAFMEINPYRFLYRSYEELCKVCGILSLPSVRNSIASTSRSAQRFHEKYDRFTDDQCQEHRECRGLSRNFPTLVNETDFIYHLKRGLRHVVSSFPRPSNGHSCPVKSEAALSAMPGVAAAAALMADSPNAVASVAGSSTKRRMLKSWFANGSPPPRRGKGGGGGGGGGGGKDLRDMALGVPPSMRRLRGGKGGGGGGAAKEQLLPHVPPINAVTPQQGATTMVGGTTGLRVAVAVSGQLSRLEVTSKIEMVLKPTAAAYPDGIVHVFLALEVGKTLYSNLDFGAILAQQHDLCGANALTPQSAKAAFGQWLGGAHFSNHSTRHVELQNWRRYRKDRPTVERMTRLQHHLSQFVHMRTCAQLIAAREVAMGRMYDVILKMRDNTIAISPFVVTKALHADGKAKSKKCVEWGGYNDKAMTIPRKYMDGALRAPSEDFFIVNNIGKGIPNSERLLRAVLDRNGVKVERVTAADLPLVDGRCSPFGWCLVEEGKDCRPTKWTWADPASKPSNQPTRPCEELNATASQRALYANRFKPRAAIAKDMSASVGLGMNEA